MAEAMLKCINPFLKPVERYCLNANTQKCFGTEMNYLTSPAITCLVKMRSWDKYSDSRSYFCSVQ